MNNYVNQFYKFDDNNNLFLIKEELVDNCILTTKELKDNQMQITSSGINICQG